MVEDILEEILPQVTSAPKVVKPDAAAKAT